MDTVQIIAGWKKWAMSGGLAETTVPSYERHLWRFFASTGKPLTDVTFQDATAYSLSLQNQQGHIAYAALRSLWTWLRRNGYTETDPIADMAVPQAARERAVAVRA